MVMIFFCHMISSRVPGILDMFMLDRNTIRNEMFQHLVLPAFGVPACRGATAAALGLAVLVSGDDYNGVDVIVSFVMIHTEERCFVLVSCLSRLGCLRVVG